MFSERARRAAGLAAVAAIAAAVVLVLVLRGDDEPAPPTTPSRTVPTVPPPPRPPQAGEAPLVAGLTEANPHLIAPGEQPPAFAPWRDHTAALGLSYLRVLVDWRRVQPSPDAPPDFAQPADGCLRGLPP